MINFQYARATDVVAAIRKIAAETAAYGFVLRKSGSRYIFLAQLDGSRRIPGKLRQQP
jgi:hypothetical protein